MDIQVHPSMYVYIRAHTSTYKYILCYTETHYCQVRRARAYLDSLSMDGAEVAINCLCSARSCATCWCPDSELADAHRGECTYRRMAGVMEESDAARGQLLAYDDGLIGLVKDVKAVEGGSGTGCFRAMHDNWCPSSSSSCLPPRTNYINCIWASLETTLCQLYSIATLRSCDILVLSTAKGSHWSPLHGSLEKIVRLICLCGG